MTRMPTWLTKVTTGGPKLACHLLASWELSQSNSTSPPAGKRLVTPSVVTWVKMSSEPNSGLVSSAQTRASSSRMRRLVCMLADTGTSLAVGEACWIIR